MEAGTVETPRPDDYQPPLSLWDHGWRLAACVVMSAIFWSWVGPGQLDGHVWQFVLDVALGVVSYPVVLLRRRWPLTVALVLNIMAAGSALAGGPAALAAVSLATRRQPRELVSLGVVIYAASTVFYLTQPFAPQTSLPYVLFTNGAFVAVQLGWGMFIGSRRELVWALRRRLERAEAEHEERIAGARVTERAQIAREMHDVLAHRISQISLHAGALTYRDDLDADRLRRGVRQIQISANEALGDLRDVLGVLRDPGSGAPDRPQPTYADLPELIVEARAAGTRITFSDELDASGAPVPEAIGRTLYRIVQEGITNVRKHAPGAIVTVRLSGGPADGITLDVRNPLGFSSTGTPGAGLGLIGLTERVQLRGGQLAAQVESGEHLLRAWLPWSPA